MAVNRNTFLCLLACCVSLVPAQAFAEPPAEALELNKQAQEHYQAKDFRAAAEKFDAAYEIFPEPQILLGEALSWFRADVCKEAKPSAMLFLKTAPDAPEIDQHDMGFVIAECGANEARALIAKGDLDGAQAKLEEARALDAGNRADESLTAVEAELATARAEEEKVAKTSPGPEKPVDVVKPAPEPVDEGISTRTWIGGGLIGLSAIVAGSSLAFYAVNIDDANAYNDGTCSDCDPDKLRSNATLNRGLYVGAGVLAAVGIGVLLWPEDEGEPTVSVGVSDGGASFTFQSRF